MTNVELEKSLRVAIKTHEDELGQGLWKMPFYLVGLAGIAVATVVKDTFSRNQNIPPIPRQALPSVTEGSLYAE